MNIFDSLRKLRAAVTQTCVGPKCGEPGQYEGPNGEPLCAQCALEVARAILGGINRDERRARQRAARLGGRGFTKTKKKKRRRP